jgi:hypothetical protein
MNTKGRFDCLIEERNVIEMEKTTVKKNTFKKEGNGRFSFQNEIDDFGERRNDFRERRNDFGERRNDFGGNREHYIREQNLNNFDKMRGGTYGRPSGVKYNKHYNERDCYNSFNKKRKTFSESKEKPKKEFKVVENDFPELG